jgi:excinuclease ABC A subunit
VFDTIATEAQRQLYENFTMFVRNFLPRYAPPQADAIENLSMPIVVDQKRLGGGSHSTVGTITDIAPVLRLLYSRVGKPYVGYSNAFSFNDPQGMCPECNGLGKKMGVKAESFVDMNKSLNEGAVQVPVFATWENSMYPSSKLFDNNKKIKNFTPEELDLLLYSKPRKIKMQFGGSEMNITYQGIIEKFTKAFIKRDLKTMSERTQKKVAPYIGLQPCPLCKGARLSQAALSCRINGKNIAELSSLEITELIQLLGNVNDAVAVPMLTTLKERLQHLVDIGLDYLSLDRETSTLSGGESQRIKMVKHLSSSLVDVMYIFDEPSVGLHLRDVHRLNELLKKLRDKGNTVIVVEHDPDVIKAADHVVDVGPHAGSRGGTIMFEGTFDGLLKSNTLTGRHMKQSSSIKKNFRPSTGTLAVTNARVNNLQGVNVNIPKGILTVITGVAGSGKSSLIHHSFIKQHSDVVVIDQSAVGTSTRSNPATYTGIMDDVRKAFASANNVSASLFSFNSEGACENCQGAGVTYTDLAFLDGIKIPCEICQGKRFKEQVLTYHLDGKSIADVLNLTVKDALDFFHQKEIKKKLQALCDVGLDYLTLGQPLSTLSGGECQRIKLASELHKRGSIYVLDEPTTGLHMSDIEHLLAIINRLVDSGNTVIVIEHNLSVIKNADWIIDMGPEGGHKGGRVIFEGTPKDLLSAKESITSVYLKDSN